MLEIVSTRSSRRLADLVFDSSREAMTVESLEIALGDLTSQLTGCPLSGPGSETSQSAS
jgi:hypothetical protein